MIVKKIIYSVLFLCSVIVCNAQSIFVDINENSQNKALFDTAKIVISDLEGIDFSRETFISETHQIPAYALYGQLWDTEHLRSKQFTIPFSDDMLKIILVESYNMPFIFPCRGTVSLPYGPVRKGGFHTGVDYKLNLDDPIYVCFDGVVRIAGYYGDYGKVIVVRHYNGLETVYAHLNKLYVKPGQVVKAGNTLGTAGNSGNAKETTLHFETRFLNEYFNPEIMLNSEDRSLNSNILTLEPANFNITPIPTEQISNLQQINKPTTEAAVSKSPSSAVKENQEVKYHIVKQGETLFRISKENKIPIEELFRLNNLTEKSVIQVGEKLRIK